MLQVPNNRRETTMTEHKSILALSR
ncbi:MAG: hypothetical protein K0Q69_1667, partial [Devosia sp.]|nr:hypothetical protein [Devosia sp.]